jgi:hypothetical protein
MCRVDGVDGQGDSHVEDDGRGGAGYVKYIQKRKLPFRLVGVFCSRSPLTFINLNPLYMYNSVGERQRLSFARVFYHVVGVFCSRSPLTSINYLNPLYI